MGKSEPLGCCLCFGGRGRGRAHACRRPGRRSGSILRRTDHSGGKGLLSLAPLDLRRRHAVQVGLPDQHHLVRAARGEEVSVRGEARAVDGPGVALQGEQQAALAQVPDLYGAVLGRRGHVVARLCAGCMWRRKGAVESDVV
jgi:hypothetical protein